MTSEFPIRIINAVAPIRICDIGGWTDTWFAEYGNIFNIGVYPYAEVQIREYALTDDSQQVTIYPENFQRPYPMDPNTNGDHPMLESAIRRIGVPKDSKIFVMVHSEAPAGCSTGTSASVSVALIGALCELNHKNLSPLEIAYQAHQVETTDLGQQSGIQDQIAAAYGGVNYIRMLQYYPYDNQVEQLSLPDSTWWELEKRICLVSLGRRHTSSDVHRQVINHLETDKKDAQALLTPLRLAATSARNAILNGDFVALGQAATDCNEGQRQLHSELICSDADKIMDIARSFGALGAKVNGAGGNGGSVSIISGQDMSQKRQMIEAIKSSNPSFNIINTYLSRRGLRVWSNTPDKI